MLRRVALDASNVRTCCVGNPAEVFPSMINARWFLDSYWAQLTIERDLGGTVAEEAGRRRATTKEELQARQLLYGDVELARQLQILKETLLLLELDESRGRSAVTRDYHSFACWAVEAERSWGTAAKEAGEKRVAAEKAEAERLQAEGERKAKEEEERRRVLELMSLERAQTEQRRQDDLKSLRQEELDVAARLATKRREMEERLTTLEALDKRREAQRRLEQQEEYELLLVQEASLKEAIQEKEHMRLEKETVAARQAEEERDMQYAALLQQEMDLQVRLEEKEAEARRRKAEEERRLQDERDEAYARLLQEEETLAARMAAKKKEDEEKAAAEAKRKQAELEALRAEERRLKEERLRTLEATASAPPPPQQQRRAPLRYDEYGYPIVEKPPRNQNPHEADEWELVEAPSQQQQQPPRPYQTQQQPVMQAAALGVPMNNSYYNPNQQVPNAPYRPSPTPHQRGSTQPFHPQQSFLPQQPQQSFHPQQPQQPFRPQQPVVGTVPGGNNIAHFYQQYPPGFAYQQQQQQYPPPRR